MHDQADMSHTAVWKDGRGKMLETLLAVVDIL